MKQEKLNINEQALAALIGNPLAGDRMNIDGRFEVECRDADGNLKWKDTIENLVVTVGMNLMLDTLHEGSAYSVTGPYMGLISSVSWSAVAAGDTMASHAGWTEAGPTNAPDYSGTRKTAAWDEILPHISIPPVHRSTGIR